MALNVEIALLTGLGGGQDQYFTLNDPTRGLLDSTSYLLAYFDVFATVTSDVRRVTVSRGRSNELDRVRAGQCTIELNNHDRLYDPVAGTAVTPYGGNMVPRKAVRVTVDGLRVFTGQVEDWSFTYQVGGDSVAGVNAVDGFSLLAQANLAGTSFPAESTGSRITAVTALTSVGWPTANLNVDTGLATVAAGSVSATDNALQYLQQVEASEPGVLFINRGGTLEFRDRSTTQTTPTVLFSSTAGTQIPYTAIEVEYGTEQLHNRVVVTTPTGTVTTGDATSQGAYGLLSRDFPTLLSTDAQATDLADFLLARYKDPTFRIRKLGVMVNDLTTAQQAEVVGLDLGDRVRVTFTPNNVGSAIVKDLTVEQIDHDLEPLGVTTQVHRMVLGLSEAVSAFTLDVDTLDSSSPYGF